MIGNYGPTENLQNAAMDWMIMVILSTVSVCHMDHYFINRRLMSVEKCGLILWESFAQNIACKSFLMHTKWN